MRERISLATCAVAISLICPSCHSREEGSAPAKSSSGAPTVRQTAGNPEAAAPASDRLHPLLPNPTLTPGDTLPVTKEDFCVPGYSKKVRNVPTEIKRQAYGNYGIPHHQPGDYEIDHLISLELGGSNSLRNLWPQSFKTQPWNAHVKDALENRLHEEVCSGKIEMTVAQQEIAHDWIAAYKKHFHVNLPPGGQKSVPAEPDTVSETEPTAAQNTKVWVNTGSGKYWYAGTQYYGKTKEGKYMTEEAAQREGYTAAKGQQHDAQQP